MEVKNSGKVIGQLSTITKQSEQGATEAMGQLEKTMAAAELAVQEWEKVSSPWCRLRAAQDWTTVWLRSKTLYSAR